jgi:hypothetical protein
MVSFPAMISVAPAWAAGLNAGSPPQARAAAEDAAAGAGTAPRAGSAAVATAAQQRARTAASARHLVDISGL